MTFKGNYSGTKILEFKIKPKGTSITKINAGKKQFTVNWSKQSTQTTGYQIEYSTRSDMKNSKKVFVSGNKKTSYKISGLKSGKKYYVRIRTYKTRDGVKYYSSPSGAKTVKTK